SGGAATPPREPDLTGDFLLGLRRELRRRIPRRLPEAYTVAHVLPFLLGSVLERLPERRARRRKQVWTERRREELRDFRRREAAIGLDPPQRHRRHHQRVAVTERVEDLTVDVRSLLAREE